MLLFNVLIILPLSFLFLSQKFFELFLSLIFWASAILVSLLVLVLRWFKKFIKKVFLLLIVIVRVEMVLSTIFVFPGLPVLTLPELLLLILTLLLVICSCLRTLWVKASEISKILVLGSSEILILVGLFGVIRIKTGLIVVCSEFRVTNYAVCICNFFEFVKCAGILVRMVLLSQFIVLLLDIRLTSTVRNP